MVIDPPETREGSATEEQDSDDDQPDVACTLTADGVAERRAWLAEELVPHLVAIEERADGFTFVFERTPEAYASVAEAVWRESRCCSWATFDVELPSGDGQVRWHARSDRAEGVEFFDDALRELRRELADVPAPD